MNERIKELTRQAGISILYEYDGYDGHAAVANLADIEKFAELIVGECISITDELVVNSTRTSDELYADHNGALFEVKRRIKQHFGVEE